MRRQLAAAVPLGCGMLIAACGTSVTGAQQSATTGARQSEATPPVSAPPTQATPPAPTAITAGAVATCQPVTPGEIAQLFQRWNEDVTSGDPKRVVENYAEDSILVPTASNEVRRSAAEKVDYFEHFLADRPSGTIQLSDITLGCNMAVDSGLYTFTHGTTGRQVPARYSFTYTWQDGQWRIVSHHSSGMPEPDGAVTTSASTTSGATGGRRTTSAATAAPPTS